MKLLITTNPGLEDITVDELVSLLNLNLSRQRLGINIPVKGRIIVDIPANFNIDKLYMLAMQFKSVHKVSVLLSEGNISKDMKGLKEIYEITLNAEISSLLNENISFAIRAERIGKHEFTSIDVAKYAGQAIVDLTKKRFETRAPVNLDYPAVIFDALVIDDKYYLALRISGEESLHKRGYRVYDHPAALKPTIAYSMLKIAELKDGETLLDPMCGGGTIVIEAARNYKLRNIYCMDISPKHLKGAIMNAIASSTLGKINFILGDARKINEYIKEPIDAIVTNPPYGIRMLRYEYLRTLYVDFLRSSRSILSSKGRIIVITSEYILFKKEAEKLGYKITHARKVLHGNLEVGIIKIAPK